MSTIGTEVKIKQKSELYGQYSWFKATFLPAIQTACDEFFSEMVIYRKIIRSTGTAKSQEIILKLNLLTKKPIEEITQKAI